MNIQIAGVGLWTRGLTCYQDLVTLLAQPDARLDGAFVSPKPGAITAKERRRAGLLINLAVEVAHQACEHAGVDKRLPPSVFVSAMGDTVITDYMCRKLAAPEKLLSPTKFHNSVHNAPSGYWTISAQNRAPSSFVGAFTHSFAAGLLEAASQCIDHGKPVLLVAYDIANEAPFGDIEAISESVGIALLIAPADLELGPFRDADAVSGENFAPRRVQLGFQSSTDGEPYLPQHGTLRALAQANPIGPGLGLLEKLLDPGQHSLALAAAPDALLQISMATGAQH